MGRLNQRQGFLVSAIAHLAILMALVSHPPAPPTPIQPILKEPSPPRRVALLVPDRELLRQLQGPQPIPPKPVATPPPSPQAKDRISIGPPADIRQKELILRRDEDLVMPKGTPSAAPSVPPPAPEETPGNRGPERPSIASSLRKLDERLQMPGAPTATGQQIGGLFFDPQGADFTAWANHFKNEVYRNWILPQTAMMGFGGHVDFEFQVERDGRVTNVTMLKSSGTRSLDRAAQNALLASRLLPLPSDYGPPRLTIQLSFHYNEGPQRS